MSETGRVRPRDYVWLLNEAKSRVRRSVLWKRFIDGTPLENDIAVWMADLASEAVRLATAPVPSVVENDLPTAEDVRGILCADADKPLASMTVGEFKRLVASIPQTFDDRTVILPEGIHSSCNIRWHEDGPPDGETPADDMAIIITAE